MGLAIGAINAYSGASAIRPMNYPVKNQSEVSSAYTESEKNIQNVGTFPDIGAVRPVQYPNAQRVSAPDAAERLAKAQNINRELNQVASGFSSAVTGYDSSSQSYGYQMVGSTLDLYA